MTAITGNTDSNGNLPRALRMQMTVELFAQLDDEACSPDEAAEVFESIVLINRCVADSIAARYAGRGLGTDDLRQVAYEGLVKAVHRFDPAQRNDFLTFAVPTIRGEVQRHFRDHGWSVRPPRRIQELQQRLGQVADELCQDLGREPGDDELATSLGVGREDYEEAMRAYGCFHPASLDQPLSSDGGRSVGEAIPSGQDGLSAAEARLILEPVVRDLPARDRRLLYLRFYEDRTQAEIGRELGVSQMQVSRRLAVIYRRLRAAVESVGDGALNLRGESDQQGRAAGARQCRVKR